MEKDRKEKIFRSFQDLLSFPTLSGSSGKIFPPEKQSPPKKINQNQWFSKKNQSTISSAELKIKKDKEKPSFRLKKVEFEQKRFNSFKNDGFAKFSKGSYLEAINSFTHAIELGHHYIREMRNEGDKQTGCGDLDGAIQGYDCIKEVFQKFIPLFYKRGLAKIELNDLEGAMNDFSMLLKYKADHKEAHYKRAVLKKKCGDLTGAIEDYQALIRFQVKKSSIFY